MLTPIRLLMFALATAFCIGCAAGRSGSAASNPTPSAQPKSVTSTPAAASNAPVQIPAALANVYPELAAANLPITESFAPELASRARVALFNFTSLTMQRLNIQGIYTLMFGISESGQAIPSFDSSRDEEIVIQPRQPAMITLALIPDNAPKPSWSLPAFIAAGNPPAETAFAAGPDVFTYVQVENGLFTDGYFSAASDFATFNLSVEICQELLQVVVVDQHGVLVNDAADTSDAQEFVCNSLGGAIASRALGMSYASYETFAESHPIRLSGGDAAPIEVDEDAYDSYPQTGPTLRQTP